MQSLFWPIFAFFGFAAVALGAFGAHGLKNVLSEQDLAIFETAVRYQMYHTLALGLVLVLQEVRKAINLKAVALCFIVGILVFSGSLYLLVLTQTRWLGAITPVGGVLFLMGWGLLAKRVI